MLWYNMPMASVYLETSFFSECVTIRRGPVDLGAVALDDAVIGFSEILVREKVMPRPALKGDALHLAAATIHRLDYLVTWNQQHLANPNKRTHFAVVCYRMNLPAPQIVTPDLLMTEADHA